MQKVLGQFFFVTIHVLSMFTHYSYEVHPITTMNYTFSIFTPKPTCHEQISLNPCEYEYNPKPFMHLKIIQLGVFRNLKIQTLNPTLNLKILTLKDQTQTLKSQILNPQKKILNLNIKKPTHKL